MHKVEAPGNIGAYRVVTAGLWHMPEAVSSFVPQVQPHECINPVYPFMVPHVFKLS